MKRSMIKWLAAGAGLAVWMMAGTVPVQASNAEDSVSVQQAADSQEEEPQEADVQEEAESIAEEFTDISDAEGLLEMRRNPAGAYRLTADIDFSGFEWTPFAFQGTLDGQGYSILNLTVNETGQSLEETFDGNMKVYDTVFSGLFDEMKGAAVSNLHLLNLRIDVETDKPCFIGGFAGYMENSSIEGCSVQGILQLRAFDRMFGVGGIIGYGCGAISDTSADVTLVCIDTDAANRDEQFMGGVCAAGYPDIKGCNIRIAGFDSDHGYVHDGGLVGMYMFYPKGTKYYGSIKDNFVEGKITFFEDNKNRRAYCNGFIGEIMNWDFENGRNKDQFVRDEVFKYDVDLLPHACENPVMKEEVTAPGCDFGYTTYTCETCGYTQTDHYTLKVHDYEWTITLEPTLEKEGLKNGICRNCGAEAQEVIPRLTPPPTPEITPEPESDEGDALENTSVDSAAQLPREPEVSKGLILLLSVIIAGSAIALTALIVRQGRKK